MRCKWRQWALLCAVAWLQPTIAQTAIQDKGIATVTLLRGVVTMQPSDGMPAVPLSVGAQLLQGSILRTGNDARLKLTLRDGSTLVLGEKATLKLDRFERPPEAAHPVSLLTHLDGFLRAVVAPLLPGDRFEIQTPSMVAAVRGTDWIERVDAGQTQIFVEGGRVLVSGIGAFAAQTVALVSGEGVTFSVGAARAPIKRWQRPKIDEFEAATRGP